MLRILSLLSLLFWLAVIPFCIGLIPANFISAKKRGPGFVLLAGYFGMWALFEVVTMPAVLFVKYDNFKVASVLFAVLSILCAATGVWIWYRNRKAHKTSLITGKEVHEHAGIKEDASPERKRSEKSENISDRQQKNDINVNFTNRIKECFAAQVKRMSWAERIEWLLFFVLLGFQLYKAVAYASFDGDDAYYVVESLIAQQADVMYRILPYTGRPTDLDIRHALAVFPMWIAFVAARSRIHATIVSHTIMPLVLIPLSYLVYYEIGRQLFKTNAYGMRKEETASKKTGRNRADDGKIFNRENLPIFMLLMTVFQIFGNVSIYTSETFFLTRTWQGKAVVGSLVIPALFWMFLWIYDGKQDMTGKSTTPRKARRQYADAGLWFVFVCINMTAGVCSSIAVFLVCILMALTAFCLAITERDYRVILKMGAVCIPNIIYMAVYVIAVYTDLL